jgi:hypothetical protein
MRRFTLPLLAAAAAAAPLPAAAQPPASAEAMLAEQKRGLVSALGTRRCREGGATEEIVVCGRAASPYRLPLPVEALPGETVRGEVPSPVALTKEETCTNIGQTRGCPSFDILAIGLMIGKVVVEQAIREVTDDD